MVFTPSAVLKPLATQPEVIVLYFTALNAEDYDAAAACFAPSGQLIPPFEVAITGPRAIARYLQKEAPGMTFALTQVQPQGESHYYLRGKACAPWFSLSVAWEIDLNPQGAIAQLQIHLLAKPEELLLLRPH